MNNMVDFPKPIIECLDKIFVTLHKNRCTIFLCTTEELRSSSIKFNIADKKERLSYSNSFVIPDINQSTSKTLTFFKIINQILWSNELSEYTYIDINYDVCRNVIFLISSKNGCTGLVKIFKYRTLFLNNLDIY